jgi:hypothetical protein
VPVPAANVAIVSRQRGLTPRDTHTPGRDLAATTRLAASTQAVAPSYREALAIGRPLMRETMVWYSNSACSTPWATSGW